MPYPTLNWSQVLANTLGIVHKNDLSASDSASTDPLLVFYGTVVTNPPVFDATEQAWRIDTKSGVGGSEVAQDLRFYLPYALGEVDKWQQFWFQFKIKFSAGYLTFDFTSGPSGGHAKDFIFARWTDPGQGPYEYVQTKVDNARTYRQYATAFAATIYRSPIPEQGGAGNYDFEPNGDAQDFYGAAVEYLPTFLYVENEWITFTYCLTNFPGSDLWRIQTWAARESNPTIKLMDWYSPGSRGPMPDTVRFSRLVLTQYQTSRDVLVHPDFNTWYKNLVVSNTPIPTHDQLIPKNAGFLRLTDSFYESATRVLENRSETFAFSWSNTEDIWSKHPASTDSVSCVFDPTGEGVSLARIMNPVGTSGIYFAPAASGVLLKARFTITAATAGVAVRLIGRCDPLLNSYLCCEYNHTLQRLRIIEVVGGVETILITNIFTSIVVGTDFWLEFRCGTTLQGVIDGTEGDATLYAGGLISSVNVGFALFTNAAVIRDIYAYDLIYVDTFAATIAPPTVTEFARDNFDLTRGGASLANHYGEVYSTYKRHPRYPQFDRLPYCAASGFGGNVLASSNSTSIGLLRSRPAGTEYDVEVGFWRGNSFAGYAHILFEALEDAAALNCYRVSCGGGYNTIELHRENPNGTITTLQTVAFTFAVQTHYRIKIQVRDTAPYVQVFIDDVSRISYSVLTGADFLGRGVLGYIGLMPGLTGTASLHAPLICTNIVNVRGATMRAYDPVNEDMIVGKDVAGERGLGVLGNTIPSTGEHGASYLYASIVSPTNDYSEIRGEVVAPPSGVGVIDFFAYENGSFNLEVDRDGIYSFDYQMFIDGVNEGTASVYIFVGAMTNRAITASGSALVFNSSTATVVRGTDILTTMRAYDPTPSGDDLIAGKDVAGNRGLGVLTDDIPSSGEHGAAFLYPLLLMPDHSGLEVMGRVVAPPAQAGVVSFFAYENSSFVLVVDRDGLWTFDYQLYVSGQLRGIATVTVRVQSSGDLNITGLVASADASVNAVPQTVILGSIIVVPPAISAAAAGSVGLINTGDTSHFGGMQGTVALRYPTAKAELDDSETGN